MPGYRDVGARVASLSSKESARPAPRKALR